MRPAHLLALAGRNPHRHFPHYTNQGSRPAGAVRDGGWKLVEHYEDGRVELFDLAADPGETKDLAAMHPERAAELRLALDAWRKSTGAQESLRKPGFDPALHRKVFEDPDVSRLRPEARAAGMTPGLHSWRRAMDAAIRKPPPGRP